MTSRQKRHLLVGIKVTACGLHNPDFGTRNPEEVTCKGCRRTVAMADAEVRQRSRPRTRHV